MLRWLAGQPAYVLFPIFIAAGLIVTFLLDALMRRYVAPDTRERATHTAGVMLQVIATIYAILIGFVIIDEYTRLNETQAQVSSKAAALAVIDANSRDFPGSDQIRVRAATRHYARVSMRSEIPRLKEDAKPDRSTDRALDRVFRAVQATEPTSVAERAAYDASLRSLDEVVRTKAELIDAARPAVPTTLFWMLFVVGVSVMGIATLLDTKHRKSHLFIVSTLGLVIFVTFALVVSLDFPFGGIIRVTDAPLRDFLASAAR
ncbi:MAG: DUF4239 domain-containing protein [Acidimicrobiia bacterium]